MSEEKKEIIDVLQGCIDSLKYVNDEFEGLSGWGVRAERMGKAAQLIEKLKVEPQGMRLAEYMMLKEYERDLFGYTLTKLLTPEAADARVTAYGNVYIVPMAYSYAHGLGIDIHIHDHPGSVPPYASVPCHNTRVWRVNVPRYQITDSMLAWALRRRFEIDHYDSKWRMELAQAASGKVVV